LALPVDRWLNDVTPADASALARVKAPVLDVGCGPGRHLQALAKQGVLSLGVDTCEAAVSLARRRGVAVLERSVFDPMPGTGRWATALLLDGNFGIGGRPHALLNRIHGLLRSKGSVIVEMESPRMPTYRSIARIEAGPHVGPWFPWAMVSTNDIDRFASLGGMAVVEKWTVDQRWFAHLEKVS